MTYRPRALAATIRRALRTFPAVLVTGARQSGKTTLLRHEFGEGRRFVSLERPDVRARALADPLAFLGAEPPPVILDEVQYAPELLHYVKERIDENRKPGRWILSGSQSLALMQDVSQSLAGRVAVLHLDPFSVEEALGDGRTGGVHERIRKAFAPGELRPTTERRRRVDLADWLLRGGFPEIRLDRKVDRKLWFSGYVQTYLERDVRSLLQVGDLAAFGRFVALAAARTGCLLNLSDLARDAGVAPPTAKRWLSVLEACHLVYLLRPYHRNFGKRLVKSPKLYFLDPGLATFLVGLHDPEAVLHGPSIGALFETAVLSEWVKTFRQAGEPPPLFFWRAAGGLEVDLLIERNGRLYGLEIKATETPTPHHGESLACWLELAGPRVSGALACLVDAPVPLRPGIRAVPWHGA